MLQFGQREFVRHEKYRKGRVFNFGTQPCDRSFEQHRVIERQFLLNAIA